jgi:hypothetical protein
LVAGHEAKEQGQMAGQVIRRLKPEEEELLRKREELAGIRVTLAERELELADFRSQLAVFEGRYLRQVGVLYAELDDWKARISELRARLDPSATSQQQAENARDEARRTHEAAHGEASKARDYSPSPELKTLFREAAKHIHPDFATDATDQERRTRFMAEANRAYQTGDADALQHILDEYQDGANVVKGEGIGAELVRIIRQISLAKDRVSEIERQLVALGQSEIALLKKQVEEHELKGRDLLAELATAVRERIGLARKEYQAVAKQQVN